MIFSTRKGPRTITVNMLTLQLSTITTIIIALTLIPLTHSFTPSLQSKTKKISASILFSTTNDEDTNDTRPNVITYNRRPQWSGSRQMARDYPLSLNNASSKSLSQTSDKKGVNTSNTVTKEHDSGNNNSNTINPAQKATSPSFTNKSISTPRVMIARKKQKRSTPPTGYNAKAICELYDRRPLEVGWRLNILGLPLLGWYFGLVSDKVFKIDHHDYIQQKRGEELRQILERSGSVALIKTGQAASLRPDLIKNKMWAIELGKLVDAVGQFPDTEAMDIMRRELDDLAPKVEDAKKRMINAASTSDSFSSISFMNRPTTLASNKKNQKKEEKKPPIKKKKLSKLEKKVLADPVLNLFEFSNDGRAVASASIGQVYKAKIKRGPLLEAAIGKENAKQWGGKTVAIKIQRPNAELSASLDMYLIRRAAMWLSKFRGGDIPAIADQFGEQLFGELDYVREANNCNRFKKLYGDWEDVVVPASCLALTRKTVLVQEWVEGIKGPWDEKDNGSSMVRTGLRCSVNQLLDSGLVSFSRIIFQSESSLEILLTHQRYPIHYFYRCTLIRIKGIY